MKEKINHLIKNGAFSNLEIFGDLLLNINFYKRYSIMKNDRPFRINKNQYKTTFCFFFYDRGFLSQSFYCELIGTGMNLENEIINCYTYPCNDVNRADCWEWVEVSV